MANEGDEPPKDYDRMSLGSLKRELEVQKSKTEMAREEARARRAEEEKKAKAFPVATVAMIVVLGVGAFFGLVYALRESFPAVAHSVLPIFMYSPPDTGPRPTPHDAAVMPVDAGAEPEHHVVHHPHTPPASATSGGGDLGLGDLGGGSDPIEGVGSGGR